MIKQIKSSLQTLFIFFAFFFSCNLALARDVKEIAHSKADFILEVAFNIYFSEPSKAANYKIGLYGRDLESKLIFSRLQEISKGLTIDDKPIKVYLYKNMRSVESVDLIYISGTAKIRLGDLHEKLVLNPYTMVTENYPFGSSPINFSIDSDNQLMYEIQAETIRNGGALIRRKILENNNRIVSASQWEAKLRGSDSLTISRSIPRMKEIANDTIVMIDTLVLQNTDDTQLLAKTLKDLHDCETEKNKMISAAKTQFNWLLSFAFLALGGLSYYIFRLRKQQ